MLLSTHTPSTSAKLPIIDFSYTDRSGKPSEVGVWQFNIPLGGTWHKHDQSWKYDVLALQRKYGCYRIVSGSPQPLKGALLGVYVMPGLLMHRDDHNGIKMCHCHDDEKATDLVRWPPRW